MQKIPSLFKRDFDNNPRQITEDVTPGCEWVIQGEGVATRKWDGTCCMVRDGKLYKRYMLKQGRVKPEHFEPVTDVDPNTGKQAGWVPIGDGPEDQYFREALYPGIADGTYELCGPKVQGNAEILDEHKLIPHGIHILNDCPRDYHRLGIWLAGQRIEGVVFHRGNGEMCKVKKQDFGLRR